MNKAPSLGEALRSIPAPVAEALEREFTEQSVRFARQDWGPAELHGGRFAEALFRYLEWKHSGSVTPLDRPLNRLQLVQNVEQNTSLDQGIRFHVRRCAELLMDVRNKRDVAHLGREIDVNEMDAHLVMRLSSWALAEIVRVEGQVAASEAQKLIDRLAATHVPLVEKIAGDIVLLEKGRPAWQRSLIVLFHEYPEPLKIGALRAAVGYSNTTAFREDVLGGAADRGLLHLKDGFAYLTSKGVAWIENNVDLQLDPSA